MLFNVPESENFLKSLKNSEISEFLLAGVAKCGKDGRKPLNKIISLPTHSPTSRFFSEHFQSSHNALRKTAGMSNPLNGVFLACVWLEVHFSGIFYLRSGTYVHIFFFLIFVRNSACGTHIWVKMTNIKLPPNDLCNDTIGVATEIFSGEGRQRLDGELGGI